MTKSVLAALALLTIAAPASAGDAAIGDSIALGTGRALHIATFARVGASSCAILGFAPRASFERVVISAGVNDPPGRCVAALRGAVHARIVVWICPVNSARQAVELAASAYGDRVIEYLPGRDGIHPAAYSSIAAQVRAAWGAR
jgi:hypothetical protein